LHLTIAIHLEIDSDMGPVKYLKTKEMIPIFPLCTFYLLLLELGNGMKHT
jgi:hypothetical protein